MSNIEVDLRLRSVRIRFELRDDEREEVLGR